MVYWFWWILKKPLTKYHGNLCLNACLFQFQYSNNRRYQRLKKMHFQEFVKMGLHKHTEIKIIKGLYTGSPYFPLYFRTSRAETYEYTIQFTNNTDFFIEYGERNTKNLYGYTLGNTTFSQVLGPALTAVWSKAPPLTARCLSPLPGFESRPAHVRKLPVTWG